jgi:hypothetical protein
MNVNKRMMVTLPGACGWDRKRRSRASGWLTERELQILDHAEQTQGLDVPLTESVRLRATKLSRPADQKLSAGSAAVKWCFQTSLASTTADSR